MLNTMPKDFNINAFLKGDAIGKLRTLTTQLNKANSIKDVSVKAVVKFADASTGEVKVTPDAILSPVIVADAILAPVIVLFARSANVISPSAIMAEEITFAVILSAVLFESAIFLLFY